MKNRIIQSFLLLALGVLITKFCYVSNDDTPIVNSENLQTRAGISNIDFLSANIEVVNNEIVATGNSESSLEIHYDTYYVNDKCSIMEEHTYDSKVLFEKDINDELYCSNTIYTNETESWSYVAYYDDTGNLAIGYIETKYLSKEEISYNDYQIPTYSGFKSYMGDHKITNTAAPAYIVSRMATPTQDGLLTINGRYLIAVGYYFNVRSGDYVDLILENGVVIPCIVCDRKQVGDTDSLNLFTTNGCMSEFVVRANMLPYDVNYHGTVSVLYNWDSPVASVRAYNKNIME